MANPAVKNADPFAECENCPARPGCAAGCYHNNRATTGDANKPPRAWCEMRRRMIPVVLEIDREIGKLCPNWYLGGQSAQRRSQSSQQGQRQQGQQGQRQQRQQGQRQRQQRQQQPHQRQGQQQRQPMQRVQQQSQRQQNTVWRQPPQTNNQQR